MKIKPTNKTEMWPALGGYFIILEINQEIILFDIFGSIWATPTNPKIAGFDIFINRICTFCVIIS